jgi:small subunit ribosomal protein S18e
MTVQSLIVGENGFQQLLRVANTNIDGKNKVMYALTSIRGIGRRFSNLVLKKADIDLNRRLVFSSVFLEHSNASLL